jgi:hypothetical protein
MKKLLFIALLFVSFTSFAQETFVRNFTSYINTKNGISEKEKETYLVVVFNPNNQKKIVFNFSNENKITLLQNSGVENGKTNDGFEYQGIYTINEETGEEVYLQLFHKGVLRLIFDKDDKMEFYK